MLSAPEILARLAADGERRLSIIPAPRSEKLEGRRGTSIDLRLGRWFRSFKQTHTPACNLAPTELLQVGDSAHRLPTKQHYIPFRKKFVVHPGSFVLGATLEWIDLPSDLSAYVTGKSTLGRHGLIIETAAGIHPGFSGCLTLELANVGEIPLEIYPGMEICQIFFHEVASVGEVNKGVASGFRKPALPRQSTDAAFERLVASYGPESSEPPPPLIRHPE